jgi:acetyltransferase-like isoleucine patch superfamily enzyme
MEIGAGNRLERGKLRRPTVIKIGNNNALTNDFKLWPEDTAHHEKRIIIGDNNYFNKGLMIDACNVITVGDNNMFGPDVYITDSNHAYGPGISPGEHAMKKGVVKIGNHCWIGAKVIILKDVELGDHCVVAAGAVVTKSFPAGSVIAGVPAKLLRNIHTDKGIESDLL